MVFDVAYIPFPPVRALALKTKAEPVVVAPVPVVTPEVNTCEPVPPVVTWKVTPEVELPIAVEPDDVFMFTGAPFIANVPEEVIVAEERPVALIVPEFGAKVKAPVVKVKP